MWRRGRHRCELRTLTEGRREASPHSGIGLRLFPTLSESLESRTHCVISLVSDTSGNKTHALVLDTWIE